MSDYKIIKSVEMDEGSGARVKRLFPTENYKKHHDPFVLMDEFFVEAPAEFPPHEHKGFEAISYMLDGSFKHEDNQGNKSEINKGGVQAFNAGKSIVHSEAPGEDGKSHGIQLWLKLPEKYKNTEPEYFTISPEDMKTIRERNLSKKIVINNDSPINLHTKLIYNDIRIDAESTYKLKTENNVTGIIYLLEGKVEIDEKHLEKGEAILLSQNTTANLNVLEDSRFIELKGKAHNEDIRIKGSFVE